MHHRPCDVLHGVCCFEGPVMKACPGLFKTCMNPHARDTYRVNTVESDGSMGAEAQGCAHRGHVWGHVNGCERVDGVQRRLVLGGLLQQAEPGYGAMCACLVRLL